MVGELLDEIARTVAAGGSRRAVLRRIGGGLVGALVGSLGWRPESAGAACPTGSRQCLVNGPCCPGKCCNGSACCAGCCSGTTSNSCVTSTSRSLCGKDGQACFGCGTFGNSCGPNGTCTCCPAGQPGCGIACPVGAACTGAGACGDCPNGGTACNGACKLPNGATGCTSPGQCASGVCSTGNPRTCVGVPSGGSCACDAACVVGTCVGGFCGGCTSAVNCPPLMACNTNTHACTNACGSGTTACSSGCCHPDDDVCVDGTSNQACATGGSFCQLCAVGQRCSGGACICDTSSNCAGCCSGNICTSIPTPSQCGINGGSCKDCSNDANGHICLANGTCGCSTTNDCPNGRTCCSGACFDTQTDPNNCGACGTACSGNNIPTRTCASGVCNGACASGFADCNGAKLIDGCEINLNTDPSNCGGCGTVCSSNHVPTPTCSNGVCNGACASGFADCNGNRQVDGCETNLNTDPNNCGACGNVCPAAQPACVSGTCCKPCPSTNSPDLCCPSGTTCCITCSGSFSNCLTPPNNCSG